MKYRNVESGWKHTVLVFAALAFAMGTLIWSYWPIFAELAEEWSKNPLYSHGYLIPVFAVFLLWFRRKRIPSSPLMPSWWALAFLLIGSVMRLGSAYYYFSWPDRASVLFMLVGAALALGGWPAVRWAGPSILFMVFMIPLPGFFENNLVRPLQRVSTIASTNVLQTLGFFAQADGNVIILSEVELGIVEACSGLRMLSVFVAMTVGTSFFMQRPLWQKLVVVSSSFLIAILCNVIRISATGILYEVADHKWADFVFHDVAGWLMMPLALILLWVEVRFLDMIYRVEAVNEIKTASQSAPLLGRAVSSSI